MATVQRYVNTASSGGDGTTNATSGSTAAYASLSSWEANSGGSATDDYIVDCCGSAADTTAVQVDFTPNITTGSVTIRGNRSDSAGFYDGNEVISTSHYRIDAGNVINGFRIDAETNVTVDGIQVIASHSASNGGGIRFGGNTFTIQNCRVYNGNSTDFGIGTSSNLSGGGSRVIRNNLVVGFDADGINCRATGAGSATWDVLHNTVYGDGSANGITIISASGSTSTFNIKANAIAGSGSGVDIDVSGVVTGTVVYADNATDQYDLGTTDEIDLGTTTDAWTSPGTSTSSDFSVKDTSSALYNAVNPTLVTTDITDFTRDGTNHDVGAFEFQAGGSTADTALDTDGAATATAAGASIQAAPASATGSAAATAATASIASADLSATGAATATLEGEEVSEAFAETALSTSGSATATAAAATIDSADLSSAGSATATAVGAATDATALSAAGTGTGTLEGAEVVEGIETTTLSAAGAATATAAAATIESSNLSAAGASTATLEAVAVEPTVESTDLSAAGAATATAATASIAAADLSAAGTATATLRGSTAETAEEEVDHDGWLPRVVIERERQRKEEEDLLMLVVAIDQERRVVAIDQEWRMAA